MLEIKLNAVDENVETELAQMIEMAATVTLPCNQAYACANIIQLAASKALAGAGVSSIKLELKAEYNMAACEFFFRHCAEEASWQDLIAYAKSALACLVEAGEIKVYWLENMASKI